MIVDVTITCAKVDRNDDNKYDDNTVFWLKIACQTAVSEKPLERIVLYRLLAASSSL